MEGKIRYQFPTKMWRHNATGGWFFASVPKIISKEIREHFKWQEEGWGRLKASAQIEALKWETAIWFDTKKNTYLLPIKADIRKKLNLEINKDFEITIWI